MNRSQMMRSVAFYVVMLVALGVLVSKNLRLVLPDGLAAQIGHNSEALMFALLACALIQYFRPILRRVAQPWLITVPAALGLFAIGYLLIHSSLAPSIVTLNEAVIAAGFLLLYITLSRPLAAAPYIGLAIFASVVIFFNTSFVLDQAESLVPFLLAPFALDVFDRTILEPERADRPVLRAGWCVVLVVVGIAFMVLARWARTDLHGPIRLGIDYGQRASEAYWGWLLVHFYFSYWLGRLWRGSATPEAGVLSAHRLPR